MKRKGNEKESEAKGIRSKGKESEMESKVRETKGKWKAEIWQRIEEKRRGRAKWGREGQGKGRN